MVHALVRFKNGGGCSGLHWFSMDVVTVVVVDDEQVFVAVARGDDELARLIGVDQA